VDSLHGEGVPQVSDIPGQERHVRSEHVDVKTLLPAQPQVGAQTIPGYALGGQGSDDGDAAVPPGQSGTRPGRSPGGLRRLLGERQPCVLACYGIPGCPGSLNPVGSVCA
jgi:hypothetical protein